ncbi:MAG: ComEC/Rec2 family competence protein [Planctomycetota bacterium]
MKRILVAITVAFALIVVGCSTVPEPDSASETLEIYFLDMVGGGSTLIVTPLGESILIDTGSREPMHRDVDRILRACEDAGVKQIDYLVTTHFHLDHFGGILELFQRIPVRHFIDKGAPPPEHEQNTDWFRQLYPLYLQATKGRAEPLSAGDDIPLKNDPTGKIPPIRLHCVAAEEIVEGFDGDIDAPVPGFEMKKPDETDNARSIALVLIYSRFKFFAGGDITWNVEHHVAHPVNRIGKIDLYQVTHHGLDQSNNPMLLKALSPTVCVAMNGPKKGIQPRTFRDLKALPSVKAIYQIHYNTQYGDKGNTSREFIANADDPQKARYIKASVHPQKGTFIISTNSDVPVGTYAMQ